MHIRFSDFKITIFYDTSKFIGNFEKDCYYLFQETLFRLPFSSLNNKEILKIKKIINYNYSEFNKKAA